MTADLTGTEQIRIEAQATAVANALANVDSHPKLWGLYWTAAHRSLTIYIELERMQTDERKDSQ